MNTIGERFRLIIETEKTNTNSFSKRLGVSNTAIIKIVKGESKPGFDIIEAVLVEFPNISSDWLIHGKGQMANEAQQAKEKTGSYLQDYLDKLEKQFSEMRDMFASQKELFASELATKNRQIEKLMDLLGKPSGVAEEAKVKPMWEQNEEIGLIA